MSPSLQVLFTSQDRKQIVVKMVYDKVPLELH